MDVEDFPPPPPEVLADGGLLSDEDEGEAFEFEDSGDEVTEARPPPPPPPAAADAPGGPAPPPAPSDITAGTATQARPLTGAAQEAPVVAARTASAAKERPMGAEEAPPLPPPPPQAVGRTGGPGDLHCGAAAPPMPPGHAPGHAPPRGQKVSPYSVIDITPLQGQQQEQRRGSAPSPPPCPAPASPPGPLVRAGSEAGGAETQGAPSSPGGVAAAGYAVPVPCGYATPSGVPLIAPAYSTPVIIRHLSVDEEVSVMATGNASVDSVFVGEEDALAKWVSDPANTAWMDNPDDVIYDDVAREHSDSNTDPDDMIYDDVELGEEAGEGRGSSLDAGWSSSEFESYDEASDGEGPPESSTPHAFLRGRPPQQKTQMQKLVKAARDGTKDGLEKTRAAVKKGRSYIKTKSFCHERKSGCFEEDETELFIEVDCFNVEPVLGPAPDGLSQQQLVRRCILGSILESEKNYLEALKRILEQYEKPLSQLEPRLLSDRKLKMIFYRVREILQCHFLFQIALASRVADWDGLEMIGDVFVASFSKSMVLDAYSQYVNNFSTAMAVVRKTCDAKPGFLDFLKHRQDSSGDRVTLYGLMMKPIQRFPQFILLLQDMLKNTPLGHSDRLPLQMALTELETLAEKLNEKKREADQRCEIRHIAKAMNERYLNKLLSNGQRHLIRSDDMVETVYNERGEIIKTKERRLFLLNDVLMCATPNVRCSQDGAGVVGVGGGGGSGGVGGGGGGGGGPGHKFLLKWSVPLGLADVVEFGSSEDAPDNGRHAAVSHHSGEKVVINAKPSKLYMGPGQLYQDLQNLIHDLSLVVQISGMIGGLKGNYQNVNPAVAQDWVSGLQRLILRKEEEIRAADRCRVQLQLPGKHDKTGKPTYFNAVFNTFSPAVKQSWISNLQMAKLALEEDNAQGWFFAEEDVCQIKKQKHPLLLRQMPVVMSKLQEFKVECAVHNPEPHVNTESTADSPAQGHGCVWVASCTQQMAQIAVVSLQSSSPKVTECFNVESRVLCMAYVPAQPPPQVNGGTPPADTPAVCLGMEEGSIIVYRSSQRYKKVRLQHFFTPEKATVTSLAHSRRCLYAGLVNGAVAVYSRQQDGLWAWEQPVRLALGVLPVKALLAVGDHVWASCGGHVFIISAHTHAVERQLEAHQEEGMVVSHMVVAGVGTWIAFSSGSTLRLFHTETLEHLQDINIATPVHHLLAGSQRVTVGSLLVCYGLLLVGTNLGMTVALSVPRLQGIPKVTGRGMVSVHAHHGPVRFLTMAAAVSNRASGDRPAHTGPAHTGPAHSPGGSPEPGGGVWLGEAGCSAMALQDSAPSPASQGSLELGPEEGALYDPLQGPAQQGGGRGGGASLMVVSGGRGHRRVHRRGRTAARHEDGHTSTILVWQIPRLHM